MSGRIPEQDYIRDFFGLRHTYLQRPRPLNTLGLFAPPPLIIIKAVSQRLLVVSYAMKPKWAGCNMCIELLVMITRRMQSICGASATTTCA